MPHDPLAGLADHLRPFVQFGGSWISAPHFDSSHWADELLSGIPMGKLATLVDAKERSFARLALATGDHHNFISRFTPAFRLDGLLQLYSHYGAQPFDPGARIDAPDLHPVSRWAWKTHGVRRHMATWQWVLPMLQRSSQSIMTPHEQALHAELPADLTLFRGFGLDKLPADLEACARGVSWTNDRSYAFQFSRQLHQPLQFIARAQVPKSEVIAFLEGEREFVVLDTSALRILDIERLPPCNMSGDPLTDQTWLTAAV